MAVPDQYMNLPDFYALSIVYPTPQIQNKGLVRSTQAHTA